MVLSLRVLVFVWTWCRRRLGIIRFAIRYSLGLPVLCIAIYGRPALAQSKENSPAALDKANASYQQLCQRCHAADGEGDRNTPGVPDFTRRVWQEQKSDAQLIVSILDGRGSSMPAFRGRLDQTMAKELVAHVRAFANGSAKNSSTPRSSKDFETQIQKLQKEYEGLKKQLEELTPKEAPEKRTKQDNDKEGGREPTKENLRAAGPLFRRHCQRCHGADGKGVAGKLDAAEPPDFTRRDWQEDRSNSRLLRSILDGRKKGMPAFQDKLTEDEARDLVEFVRSLVSPRPANSRKPRAAPGESPSMHVEPKERSLTERMARYFWPAEGAPAPGCGTGTFSGAAGGCF